MHLHLSGSNEVSTSQKDWGQPYSAKRGIPIANSFRQNRVEEGPKVVTAWFRKVEPFSWNQFDGFDRMRVLTYSASAPTIARMLEEYSFGPPGEIPWVMETSKAISPEDSSDANWHQAIFCTKQVSLPNDHLSPKNPHKSRKQCRLTSTTRPETRGNT